MNILINASNLKKGGGLQVADSICRELYKYPQHRFVVILSSFFKKTQEALKSSSHIITYTYNVRNNISTLVFGRDVFLDGLVDEYQVDVVLTIFGPSRWNPRCKHLSGFAMSQLLLDDSPYLTSIKYRYNLRLRAYRAFVKMAFRHSTNHFYTENPFISERLKRLYPRASVNTVTNYYNQVFDQKDRWLIFPLPTFDGITLLSVVTPYPHKNVTIAAEIARYLRKNYPKFKFRFVFSFDKDEFHASINGVEENFLFIGKVDVSECPSLYMQSDIVFVSSLLECFTAAYPEAMRMEKPIVTTDLEFAHGLCGYAACYYSATDSVAAAEAIYKVATDKEYNRQLVENGKMQLKTFDNYEQRAEKIIKILERM